MKKLILFTLIFGQITLLKADYYREKAQAQIAYEEAIEREARIKAKAEALRQEDRENMERILKLGAKAIYCAGKICVYGAYYTGKACFHGVKGTARVIIGGREKVSKGFKKGDPEIIAGTIITIAGITGGIIYLGNEISDKLFNNKSV